MSTVIKTLLILFLSAKAIGTIVYIVLPKIPVYNEKESVFQEPYIGVRFDRLFSEERTQYQEPSIYITQLGDLILNGLYGKKDKGYAILANKKNPSDTVIIAVGEVYKGYRLKEIFIDHIELEKDGKNYALYLDQLKQIKKSIVLPTDSTNTIDPQDAVKVHLDDISYYLSNQTAIWKNISIRTLRKKGKISGFKIAWVRKNTKFSELGLKKGDIIVKINDKPIASYKNISEIYQDTLKTKKLSLGILRDEKEKELFYEVE